MHGNIEMNVTVPKYKLLASVNDNRSRHRKIFLEALKGYQKKIIKILDKMLKDVKAGRRINHMINLPMPQDMTEEYNTVINMLAMSSDKEIKLSSEDFSRFVEDKWDWTNSFLSNNAPYSKMAQVLSATSSYKD